jgi:hypothetical protein
MYFADKIFINKDPNKRDIPVIKKILDRLDIKKHLEHSFVYILIDDDDAIEVLSFLDNYVYIASKELNVDNKMAVEYLIEKEEIDQEVNKILYWCGINGIKKFVPVVSEEIRNGELIKKYANMNIFAKNITEALWKIPSISSVQYMYLEDVDEEV